jgi:hypothetical protein
MSYKDFPPSPLEPSTDVFSEEEPALPFSVEGPTTSFQQTFDFDRTESYNFSEEVPDSQLRATELPGIQGPMLPSIDDFEAAEPAAAESLSFGEGMAAPAAFISHSILESGAQAQYQSDLQGNSVAGHSYLAPLQAAQNLNQHNLQNNIASTLVGAGAMLGPEGLVAGLAAGAVVSSINFSSPVQVPTDTGESISADQLTS